MHLRFKFNANLFTCLSFLGTHLSTMTQCRCLNVNQPQPKEGRSSVAYPDIVQAPPHGLGHKCSCTSSYFLAVKYSCVIHDNPEIACEEAITSRRVVEGWATSPFISPADNQLTLCLQGQHLPARNISCTTPPAALQYATMAIHRTVRVVW
jgi:hypothetical protein